MQIKCCLSILSILSTTTLNEILSECCIHPWTAAAVPDQRLRDLRASFRSEKPTNPGRSLLHPDPTRVPRGSASSSLPRTSCWAPQLAPPPGSSGSPSPAMSPRLCLQSPTVSFSLFYFCKSDVKNFHFDLGWKCGDVLVVVSRIGRLKKGWRYFLLKAVFFYYKVMHIMNLGQIS